MRDRLSHLSFQEASKLLGIGGSKLLRQGELITGSTKERAPAYTGTAFFTICNYEQVLKDILHVERTRWDLPCPARR